MDPHSDATPGGERREIGAGSCGDGTVSSSKTTPDKAAVDLYWLPLGAGGHSVRLNGRAFEYVVARRQRRTPCDLYHSALEVHLRGARYAIEMTPPRRSDGADRGVVAGGAVGLRVLGRFTLFRYEIRRWRNGVIPDMAEAVGGARRLTDDESIAQRLVDLVPQVPCPVWGRDELRLGEMWNSNSLTSWLIARSGLDIAAILPPPCGRAPGWDAGVTAARRAGVTSGAWHRM